MTKYEQLQEHLKDNQSTWLVTGVAGFIGSNLLEKLLILNQKVVGLDNFDTGYQHNIDKAKKLLGYIPKYKISQGLDESIDWYTRVLS